MEAYSVLMSVYGKEQAAYLKESIESMLKQSIKTDDFVLVCDGPLTDGLEQVIAEAAGKHPGIFKVHRLKENRGLGEALRQGVLVCRNELIARMDSDDISVQNRCEQQLKIFGAGDVDIVGGNIQEFMEDISHPGAIRKVPCTDEEIRQFAKRRNPFNHPSIMFRKSAVLKAGNYVDCKGFEDYYLWARMLKAGMKGYNIQKILVYMRTNAGMYARRGSFSYALLGIKARWKIHKIGYSGFMDFFISGCGQLIMSLVPIKMRIYCYEKFLRK